MGFYDDNKVKQNKPVSAVPVINETPHVVPDKEPTIISPDEQLIDRKYVLNTQNNLTGVNTGRRMQIIELLKGYAEGTAVKVTYYKEHYAESDWKGKLDDTEHEMHPVHKSVLKIHGMELRMTGPLTYEHDNNEVMNKLSGEALTYPGFRPEKGDSFVMEVDTGKYGVFEVNEIPTRLSIRAATYYKIQFTICYWADSEEIGQMEAGVVDEAWFDKTRMLCEPGALLYHDEYVTMKWMREERLKMVNYYQNTFLDEVYMYSYMRPDNVYDPYVTDFMNLILNFEEVGTFSQQLYTAAPYLKTSIFRAIFDKAIPLQAVPTGATSKVHVLGSKSTLVNSLLNKTYLYFVKSPTLADWFEDDPANDYTKVPYPVGFQLKETNYVLTNDKQPFPWKRYYIKNADDTYSLVNIDPTKPTDMSVLYEQVNTYTWKEGVRYYVRVDGVFIPVDTTTTELDPNETYYTYNKEDSSEVTPDGEIPANPDLPPIPEGNEYDERVIGDLLLHLHPHYTECMMHDGDDGSEAYTTAALNLIIGGSNDHIDLLKDFLLKRAIDIEALRRCIENVWKLSPIEQFYKMPIYIFLAERAVAYIQHNSGVFDRQ